MSEGIEKEEQQETQLLPAERLTLHDFLGELSFLEWVRRVRNGLSQPPDSGEYKFAHQEIKRLWSPVLGVGVPCFLVLVLLLMPSTNENVGEAVPITVMESKAAPELDPIKPIDDKTPEPPIEPVEPPPIDDQAMVSDMQNVGPGFAGPAGAGPAGPNVPFSPQPAAFDSVSMVKSPIIMKGIYASRNPGARGSALGRYGSGGGGGGTELAVYRALRWLKKYQETDGKWTTGAGGSKGANQGPCSPAMTGLALLTFLAHGETPSSPEFGPTVERGMRWLVENQDAKGHFAQSDGNEYSLPIAAYALCEAYALTKVPMIKDAAEKAIRLIVEGQTVKGLWTYKCEKSDRNDTSYGGWCAQAVKAGVMAGLDVKGLKECAHRAVAGLKSNYGNGGFGYTAPGASQTLTPVGVLGLQLLGAANDNAVTSCMDGMLKGATCNWQQPWCKNPLYAWYYLTQAKFHRGDKDFIPWNKEFSPTIVRAQIVVPKAIPDMKGRLVDIGYWDSPNTDEHCKAYCYNTTLCALMLTVYYRHLPTYKPPEAIEAEIGVGGEDDIKVKIH